MKFRNSSSSSSAAKKKGEAKKPIRTKSNKSNKKRLRPEECYAMTETTEPMIEDEPAATNEEKATLNQMDADTRMETSQDATNTSVYETPRQNLVEEITADEKSKDNEKIACAVEEIHANENSTTHAEDAPPHAEDELSSQTKEVVNEIVDKVEDSVHNTDHNTSPAEYTNSA